MKKKATKSKPKKRNYRREYDTYHGTKKQRARRAIRNKARRKAVKNGSAKKGDGKDVHHIGSTSKSLGKRTRIISASSNRSMGGKIGGSRKQKTSKKRKSRKR